VGECFVRFDGREHVSVEKTPLQLYQQGGRSLFQAQPLFLVMGNSLTKRFITTI
jgi:hypothetical protein